MPQIEVPENLSIIVAMNPKRVIGSRGQLPWHAPEDLKHFKRRTLGHTVIMGRKTYESIGKPLKGRRNIVVTRDPSFTAPGCDIVHDPGMAITLASHIEHQPFVIGGQALYDFALPFARTLFVTKVDVDVTGDTYFPAFDQQAFKQVEHHRSLEDPRLTFATWVRM